LELVKKECFFYNTRGIIIQGNSYSSVGTCNIANNPTQKDYIKEKGACVSNTPGAEIPEESIVRQDTYDDELICKAGCDADPACTAYHFQRITKE